MQLRQNNLDKLDNRPFDVLIVGGGINGAVSAAALAAQGASVALIDKADFASFTSQESSNLAWGGIKYMETLEFGLVRKLCKSRNHLLRSYPASIKEIRFFVTLQKGFRWPRFFLFMGACLYWLMGNFFTRPPRLLLNRTIKREESRINIDNSPGGFEYSDAYLLDNDARFVFRFIRDALDRGAICANYVESRGARREDGHWVTTARDTISGRTFDIQSKVLINATGPYVESTNTLSGVKTEHRHLFSKGVHLMVDRLMNVNHVLTFFASDGRLFFVIPMGPKSCIGTTDTRVEELPARVTPEDRRFILDNINHLFRLARPLTEADIIAERCGVRPLVVNPRTARKDEGDWVSLSRKHVIEVDEAKKHISIFGGKITDCLNIGDEIAGVVRKLGITLSYRGYRWYGEPPDQVRGEFFHQAKLMFLDDLTAQESSEHLSTRLWRRYGASALYILEEIRQDPGMAEVLIKGTEYTRVELYHAARREMITTLEDFLRRRSKIALIERPETIRNAPGLMEACRILFGDQAQAKFDEYFAR